MTPHSNSLRALFIGIICASNSVLGSRTKLAVRDVSPSYFDTYQFKKLVPVLDFSQNCTEPFVWYHTLFPKVVPAPEKVKIKTCYDRPVEVAEWSFTTSETCEPGGIWRADLFWATNRDDNYFNALEHDTDRDRNKDIIKKVDLRVCIHEKSPPAASCWGEWINKPTWDYEWIVRVPDDSKYNRDQCGASFQAALKKECAPFDETKFDCSHVWNGAEIRFRTNLLCGRTRIQNAIKKATNGEMDVRCPYFVEVPVPN